MIFGKVGRIGHGKTMRAVVDAIELAQLRGAVLAANIKVRPPDGLEFVLLPMDGFSGALGELLDDCRRCDVCQGVNEWGDVPHGQPGCERRGIVVLVDEVDTIWDAREWQDMSKLDRFRIKQSRKLGCDLIWTAQFVDQVEKGLRNITEEVELLRAVPSPTIHRRERGKRPWLLMGQRFRPGAVRELAATVDPDKRMGRTWHRYRRRHEDWYNTDELVRPAEMPPPRRRKRYSQGSAGGNGNAGDVLPIAADQALRGAIARPVQLPTIPVAVPGAVGDQVERHGVEWEPDQVAALEVARGPW
jgi:Zonular occludens toxin (Zot)